MYLFEPIDKNVWAVLYGDVSDKKFLLISRLGK